jgi:hypothetical protein
MAPATLKHHWSSLRAVFVYALLLRVIDGDHVGVTDGGDDAVMRTAPLGVVSEAVVVSVTGSSSR